MLSRREFLALAAIALPGLQGIAKQETKNFVGVSTFDKMLKLARQENWKGAGTALATCHAARALIGTPYVAATLELDDLREECSVNLQGLDCVTLYETALGFARMIRNGGRTPEDLLREVTFTRYRGGKLDGYLSRLHYTSDWIFDNERKGVVRDITPSLPGAQRMDKRIDFMSTHPNSYRQLKAQPDLVAKLAKLEEEITRRRPWFVPNTRVAEVEPLLQSGDIIGIATSAAGLDCSHTGLIWVDENGKRGFLNASSVHKRVLVSETIAEYAVKYARNVGILVARPL